jgi:prepilin-type N-terminal cleavage/methylation domain-containing protein
MKRHNHGFTLVELLVVISIIGLLASIVLVSVNSARSKARDSRRISDIRQLMIALELYYDSNGHYPISGTCGAVNPGVNWCNSVQTLSGSHWIRDNAVTNVLDPFITNEPLDPRQGTTANWQPLNGGTYFYYSLGYGGSGQWYMIVFGLERYPHSFESQDGVVTCDDTTFHYGTGSNGIITIGMSCP